jgi:hypothetical protein
MKASIRRSVQAVQVWELVGRTGPDRAHRFQPRRIQHRFQYRCGAEGGARLVIAFLDASALIDVLEGREPWVHGVKQALATDLRGRHSLRTPDALQAASCLQLGD